MVKINTVEEISFIVDMWGAEVKLHPSYIEKSFQRMQLTFEKTWNAKCQIINATLERDALGR